MTACLKPVCILEVGVTSHTTCTSLTITSGTQRRVLTQEPPSRVVLRESVVFRDIKRTCVVRLMQLISRYSKNVVQLYG